MRTNPEATHRMITFAQVVDRSSIEESSTGKAIAPTRRRLALVAVAVGFGLVPGLNAIAIADQREPLNRLGRIAGRGYSDGYHACKTTGIRVLADLPPTSYSHRGDVLKSFLASGKTQQATGFATYYDQFDHACDAQVALDSQDMHGHVLVEPHMMPEPHYMPEPQYMPEPAMASPAQRSPVPSMTPNAIRLPSTMHPSPTLDPIAEAKRELEERERELNEQRQMLAEQERYRQFQVFEKLRQRDEANALGSVDLGAALSGESSPIEDPYSAKESSKVDVPRIAPKKDSKTLPNSEESSPIENAQEDESDLLSPTSTDLRDAGLFKKSYPQVHTNPFPETHTPVEASPLAQSQLQRPTPTPSRFPSSVTGSPAKLPQVAMSTLLAPTNFPEAISSTDVFFTKAGDAISELELAEADEHSSTRIVQPAEAKQIAPAQEPEKRIASGDWLIIRQPK